MLPEQPLIQFGLTEKEAKIYLAMLELGQDTVQNIAKKAEIKRPTAYIVLESLASKGLVRKMPRGNTTIYVAEDPIYLLNALKEKENTLKNTIPLLYAIYNVNKIKPQIKFYEGKKNIERVWLEDVFKSKKIDFISSIAGLMEKYPEAMEIFSNLSQKKQFSTRELITRDSIDLDYAKKYNTPNRQIRLLPQNFYYTMDIDLYENKVLLVSIKNDFLIMIESPDVAKSFQSLYELAWQSGEMV